MTKVKKKEMCAGDYKILALDEDKNKVFCNTMRSKFFLWSYSFFFLFYEWIIIHKKKGNIIVVLGYLQDGNKNEIDCLYDLINFYHHGFKNLMLFFHKCVLFYTVYLFRSLLVKKKLCITKNLLLYYFAMIFWKY